MAQSYGVYLDRKLCFAYLEEPGPVLGVLGGALSTHPSVRGKIHLLSEQGVIAKLIEGLTAEQLRAELQKAGYTVLATPRPELEWALG